MKLKKRSDEPIMISTAVRLPQNVRSRLVKAGGEHGLGEEIRRRLEASLETEKDVSNPKTAELLDAIISCAKQTAEDYGEWSDDAFSFEVLKACIDIVLTSFRPEGEPTPNPKSEGMHELLFGEDYSPKPAEPARVYADKWLRPAGRARKDTRK